MLLLPAEPEAEVEYLSIDKVAESNSSDASKVKMPWSDRRLLPSMGGFHGAGGCFGGVLRLPAEPSVPGSVAEEALADR